MKKYKDIVGDGGSNVVAQVGEQQARLKRRLDAVRFVVAVVAGKGGVGKSTVTANLAASWASKGWRVGVLDADLNGPSMAKMLGVRGRPLAVAGDAVDPPRSATGIPVMSMDLLLSSDDEPLHWRAPTQQEAHTWRGTMEAQAPRPFLAGTALGELDAPVIDLPPGTDRLATVVSLVPVLAGGGIVTIPSGVSQLVVRKSITVARGGKGSILRPVENMGGVFSGPDAATLAGGAGGPLLRG